MTKQLIKLLAIGLLGLLVFSCGGKNTEQQPESTATNDSAAVAETESFPQEDVDFETFIELFDRLVGDLAELHIREAADTLQLKALMEKYEVMSNLDVQGDVKELSHSQRVHYLRSILDCFKEFERIGDEMKGGGIEGGEKLVSKDLLEAKELFEKEYERETH